jgi:pyruvate,water dikinase
VLIEIACRKGGYLPDLSFGTHFFQDLVEANISYLPLYPDQDGTIFNRKLLSVGENRVTEFVKNYPHLVDVVKLIRVTDISGGGSLEIVMDGEANEAVAFLVPPDHSTWRMSKVKEIAEQLDPALYGVEALYVIGSTKEYTTGPGSDIDLLIHFRGTPEQQEGLLGWLDDWSIRLARENKERTGYDSKGLLDIHIVTDQDIVERTSWAVHIGSPYGAAKEIPLTRKTARSG